jgi:hypothetical protein
MLPLILVIYSVSRSPFLSLLVTAFIITGRHHPRDISTKIKSLVEISIILLLFLECNMQARKIKGKSGVSNKLVKWFFQCLRGTGSGYNIIYSFIIFSIWMEIMSKILDNNNYHNDKGFLGQQ